MKTGELKKLQGTARADRMKEGIEFELITIAPTAPTFLDTRAKKIFMATSQMLMDKSMLFNSDLHLLAMLAQELSIYEKACRELKKKNGYVVKTKTNYEQQTPWVNIRSAALKNVKEIGSLFGLDPLSREKFGGNKTTKESKNPFENI